MKKFLILTVVVLFLTTLAIAGFATSYPEGEGVQKLRPKDVGVKGEYIWVWQYLWSNPRPEFKPGKWITIGWGWGSTNKETLEEIIESQDLSFSVDGQLISDPKQYYEIEWRETYWALSFKYAHPPFQVGEHSWSVEGICPWTLSGEFDVTPAGHK